MTTPPTGGATTFLVALCASLVARGWRVSVVTQPGAEMRYVSALDAAGVEVRLDLWKASHLPQERGARLAAWVNERGPDVYLISISPDAGWLALPHLAPNIATVSVAHNDVSAFYDPVRHYRHLLDCAIGVSEDTHRKLVRDCQMPPERARRIAYGVRSIDRAALEARVAEQRIDGAPLRVGYVGRVVQLQKRVFDFVPLVAELKRRGVAFEFHIIGDGEERAALTSEFERRGLADDVKFWGWLSPEEVRARLLALDVFLLLSDYEGLPVALLEAMAHAVVPVVTEIESGNVELVRDGENGLVVAVGDAEAAAARLQLLAGDAGLLNRLRRAAWETGRRFSVEAMTDNYVACFDDLTDEKFSREHRRAAPRPYPLMPSCVSRYPTWLRKIKAHVRAHASRASSASKRTA